jgi:NAD(P)-dependent dehydrogenase (short-subunit alcohol dehydrogenase family)
MRLLAGCVLESLRTPLDILVNNAGIQPRAALEDFPTETGSELIRFTIAMSRRCDFALAAHPRRRMPLGHAKRAGLVGTRSALEI